MDRGIGLGFEIDVQLFIDKKNSGGVSAIFFDNFLSIRSLAPHLYRSRYLEPSSMQE